MKTNCLQEVGVALRRGARLTSAFLLFAWSGLALAASSFPDVASTSWASLYIEAIYGAGITTGCGSGNYCPANPVTRDQMAAFIIRAKAGEPLLPVASHRLPTSKPETPSASTSSAWLH